MEAARTAGLLAPAQPGVQRECGRQRKFILHVDAQRIARAAGVQVLGGWVQIDVELLDAGVAPVVDAPGELVACKRRADPLPVGAPPLPGADVAVDREGWVVVHIVAHEAVAPGVYAAGERQ
ncbi:hypothetical protein D3C87_1846450 [compost metagenome]